MSLRLAIQSPDVEYLGTLQKIVTQAIQGVDNRKAVGEIRFEAIRSIKKLCTKWKTMNRQTFFNEVVDCIQTCFFSANVYLGRLGMLNQTIAYYLASPLSQMKGKILRRGRKEGVSFNAVDTRGRLIITPTSPDVNKLLHFGPKEQVKHG